MSKLFSTLALGELVLRNRIAIAPMCQYSAANGEASDWHLIHLGHLALSGAGMLFTEATAVNPEGRISPSDLGLWSDKTEAALARVHQFCPAIFSDTDRNPAGACGTQGIRPGAVGRRPVDRAV